MGQKPSDSGQIQVRLADSKDIPMLEAWDQEPHVIAATSDSGAPVDYGWDWGQELVQRTDGTFLYVGMINDTPFGFLQIIDPQRESSQYWGPMEAGYRALDIWIGPPEFLGQGLGGQLMSWAIKHCFDQDEVHTILIDPLYSNKRAQRFYARFGFENLERRQFDDESDCQVMQLKRNA